MSRRYLLALENKILFLKFDFVFFIIICCPFLAIATTKHQILFGPFQRYETKIDLSKIYIFFYFLSILLLRVLKNDFRITEENLENTCKKNVNLKLFILA